jgi:single-strand DNA-binding protein
MSFDQNTITISGNLTRDAELKYTSSGTALIKFSIANSRSIKKGDTYEDIPMFFNIQKYGKAGEALHKDLIKGRNVSITGELRQDRWQDDSGQQKSIIYIMAEKIILGRTPRNHSSGNGYNPGNRTGDDLRRYQEDVMNAKGEPKFEDDMPF